MHTKLKKSATAEPSKNADIPGIFKYKCADCGESWTAHAAIVECHKCGGKSLEKSLRSHWQETLANQREKTTGLQARAGGPWKCLNCEHIFWVNGVVRNCCLPDCGSREVEPVEAKRCVTCNKWYDDDELTCPGCGTVEFSRLDYTPPVNPAPAALEAAARHLGDTPPVHRLPIASPPATAETILQISVADIAAHPDNPRQHFDQAALAELAAGFKNVGVINALTVRPMGAIINGEARIPQYQLIAGERRWRAAKIAKLAAVPCRIVDITDEEAYEVMIRENLDREDLDEIEKARSYKLGLEKCGLTQAAFAARYKKSQEHVSNTIRLLALPEAWQQRLIQREITATHARELLAWIDVPAVLDRIGKDFDPQAAPSAAEFRTDVMEAVRASSRPMAFGSYGSDCQFKPTPAQAQQLDIREVTRSWGGKERRAFNVKLWNELQGAAKTRRQAKKSQETKGQTESRARVEAENERRQFGLTLYAHKRAWLAHAAAERLTADHADLAWQTAALAIFDSEIGTAMQPPLEKQLGIRRGVDAAAALVMRNAASLGVALVEGLRGALQVVTDEPGYFYGLPDVWISHLASALRVDLEKQWTPSAGFLEIFDDKRRVELVDEGRFEEFGDLSTQMMLGHWPKGFVPQSLLWVDEHGEIKRPKNAKAKSGKKAKAKR